MIKLIKIIYFIFVSLYFLFFQAVNAQEKIKIGLLVPMTGNNKQIGESIIKAVSLAIKDINNNSIEIYPKDTASKANQTLKSAFELSEMGIKIVIGPVFHESLSYLDEMKSLTFLSLTNKTLDLPKNVISAGINSTSQFNTIKKFLEINNIQKTVFLTPIRDYEFEIKEGMKYSKIKIYKDYEYNTEPTKLTKQIEEITNYKIRKQNLKDEIKRLENSDEANKENKILNLEKKDTLGGINFDSVIIADFDESLKSVTTSLLYTDVSSERVNYITLNQWFDKSILKEENLQPIYFPSINKENYDNFVSEYFKIYNDYPNQISFLSFDLVGLVYFLIYKNDFVIDNKIFYKKNKFKGKIGIFEINKNKISHILNFYVAENNNFRKIF